MWLLHKYSAIGYKLDIFEWKNNICMRLLTELKLAMKLLNEYRTNEYKLKRIEFCYILVGILHQY